MKSAGERLAVTALAVMLGLGLWPGLAQARPLIMGNQAAFGGGPIRTYDFETGVLVNSFVPAGAFGTNNGRGVAMVGPDVFYTELGGTGFGATDFIRVVPFGGGADTRTLPNPRPACGIQDLAFSNGVLWALTGYIFPAIPACATPQVFGLNPITGAVVSGPVTIAAPAISISDGFTVLRNGNFLINNNDGGCTYNQFNPSTGALMPATTIVVPGAVFCTGVETDGVSLFFATVRGPASSLTQTTLAGALIANRPISGIPVGSAIEDITLVPEPVPTLTGWGMIGLVVLLLGLGVWTIRRHGIVTA